MIELKNIYFKYEDNLVLKNINLEIKEKSFTAILGANGSGKTTLVKLFNALLVPTRGDVIVDGINTKHETWEIRKRVGMVFQNPDDQLVYSTVEEDIAFGLENLGLKPELIKTKVKNILKLFNLTNYAKTNINMLSLGQKQLVALAGVIVMEPKYLVLDEPTTALDPLNRIKILNKIRELNREGITIVLVTNHFDDLKANDHVIILKEGTLIFNDLKKRLNKRILRLAKLC